MQFQGTQISPAIAKIMADKRDSKRVKSVFSASLHSEGMFYSHCIIKDVSSTGMKLKLQNEMELPQQFEVKTPAMSETVIVNTAWVRGDEIGVEFVEAEAEEPASQAG